MGRLTDEELAVAEARRQAYFKELDDKGIIHCDGWTAEGSVGPGWKNLVEPLLLLCRQVGVHVLQVKEKFGTLRFYTGATPDWVDALIDLATAASHHTCEECGAKHGYGWYKSAEEQERGKTVKLRGPGWYRTLCDECAVKMGYSLKEETDGGVDDDTDGGA